MPEVNKFLLQQTDEKFDFDEEIQMLLDIFPQEAEKPQEEAS